MSVIDEIENKINELKTTKLRFVNDLKQNISKHEDPWETEGFIFLVAKQLRDTQKEIDDLIRTKNLLEHYDRLR